MTMKWIFRSWLFIIILIVSSALAYEVNVPVFKLETPMHTGAVNQIALSSDEGLV